MHDITDRQREIYTLFCELKDKQAVATKLGVSRSTVRCALRALAARGMSPGLAPVAVPENFQMGKTTVQYNGAGEVIQEWRRASPVADSLRTFVDALCEEVKGRGKRHTPAPIDCTNDLLLEVPIYDAHVGKYSWDKECGVGQAWDTQTAVDTYLAAVELLVSKSPKVGTALLIFGGDYFHADTRNNVTEKSGHALDVDTRYPLNIRSGARLATRIVDLLCTVASRVRVVVISGNHSWNSEHWLSLVLESYYHGVAQVEVDTSPSARRYHKHGRCLIGIAHGDGMKMQDYPQVMAVEQPLAWADSTHRHWHLGHIHKSKASSPVVVDTYTGAIVEYLPSLTSTDAWHSEMGYVNPLRVFEGFIWHARWGQINRLTLHHEQVVDWMDKQARV